MVLGRTLLGPRGRAGKNRSGLFVAPDLPNPLNVSSVGDASVGGLSGETREDRGSHSHLTGGRIPACPTRGPTLPMRSNRPLRLARAPRPFLPPAPAAPI